MSAPTAPVAPLSAGNARRLKAVTIGECMVELARGADGRFGLAYGGDTFNAAVYMARAADALALPLDVAYATALGDDPYSAGIVAAGEAESLDMGLAALVPGRMPGLYLIETADGERSFWYWRERAPAREALELDGGRKLAGAIAAADAVLFSGVTLSLYSARGLDLLAEALEAARANGAVVAMDNNYRPRGWGGEQARARATYERFWRLVTLALPTFDDEQALWGDAGPAATVDRIAALGPAEIVVKNGPEAALVHAGGYSRTVEPSARVEPVDTTAAGDSFSGTYLAWRLAGRSPDAAAAEAHRVAGVVIRHRGAIAPREAFHAT
ncbi:MAG: sugar kinase [Hyphomicrobiaceae bacterium]